MTGHITGITEAGVVKTAERITGVLTSGEEIIAITG